MNNYSKATRKIKTLLAALGFIVLSGCNPNDDNGTFLIIELENSENIKQYSVFNQYVKTIEECNALADKAIEQIFASVPRVIPKDSKVKSWRCSLIPPERGG